MDLVFKIEDGEVKMYRGQAFAGSLGTLRPNDEQVARVIRRAFDAGRAEKAAEIREAINAPAQRSWSPASVSA